MSERPVQSLQQSPKGWKRPSARAPGSHGWALFPGPGGGGTPASLSPTERSGDCSPPAWQEVAAAAEKSCRLKLGPPSPRGQRRGQAPRSDLHGEASGKGGGAQTAAGPQSADEGPCPTPTKALHE